MTDGTGLDAFWRAEVEPVRRDLAKALDLRRRQQARRLSAFAVLAAAVLAAAFAAGAPWPWLVGPVLGAAGLHILLQRLAPPGRDYRDAVRAGILAPLCRHLDAELAASPVPAPPGWTARAELRRGDGEPILILEHAGGRGWPGRHSREGAIAQRHGDGVRILWQGRHIPFEPRSSTDLDRLRDDAEKLAGALRLRRFP